MIPIKIRESLNVYVITSNVGSFTVLRQLLTMLSLFVFFSCTEKMDMDFETSLPVLVVDGVLTDNSREQYVILSISSSFIDVDTLYGVTGAEVSVSYNENEVILEEVIDGNGLYIFPAGFKGEYGVEYVLNINQVDINGDGINEKYSAGNRMVKPMELYSLNVKWESFLGEKGWHILINAKDDESVDNYYAFCVYLNERNTTPTIGDLNYLRDENLGSSMLEDFWVHSIVEVDRDGDKTKFTLKEGDWVKLEIYTINEDYYNFIEAVDKETDISTPLFSGIPANVPTNVEGGGLGFFRVYSVVRDSVQVSAEDIDSRSY